MYMEFDKNDNIIVNPRDYSSKKQLWFFDQKTRTIKSVAQPSKSWNIQNAGKDRNLQLWNTNSKWYQLFRYQNNQFVNVRNLVMQIEGGKIRPNANVVMWKQSGDQKWGLSYDDEDKKPLPEKHGFDEGRVFYMRTSMSSGRVIEVEGGRNLVLRDF